jgi:WD40 repeat protein
VQTRKVVQPLLLGPCQIPLTLAGLDFEDVTARQLPSVTFTSRLLALARAPRGLGDPVPLPGLPLDQPSGPPPPRWTAGPVLRGHGDGVADVAIAADGRWLASAGLDGTVRLWGADGSAQRTLPGHPAGATGVAIAPDGTWLATSGDRTVATWEASGRVRAKLGGHTKAVWAVAISPDGGFIASAGIDGSVRIWASAGGAPTTLEGHTEAALTVAIAPDSTWLASGGADAALRLWRRTGQALSALPLDGPVWSVAIAPNGKWLVACASGAAWVWTSDGAVHRIFEPAHVVRSVAIAPSGPLVVGGCDDGAIRLWRMGRGPDAVLTGHDDVVQAVAIAPSGTWLASGGKDRTVRLWRLGAAV